MTSPSSSPRSTPSDGGTTLMSTARLDAIAVTGAAGREAFYQITLVEV